MTTERPPRTVGTRFGPYRLDRLIGRGGMGEVFEAYDTVKDRAVAVKVLAAKLNQDPVFRERFRRESHAAARLTEPHVIPIHDYGEIDGQLYIDMRLVDGENLRAVLKREAPLAPERAVAVIRQIAAALDAAHADDLVHRDIKPDNILLTTDGFAYLVDFGIAQSSTSESLTADGSAIGSFHYMAPERFTSRLVTPAVDSYALACVLYECLTGARPFPAETDGEIMRAHLFEPPPRPSMIRREVPVGFDEVIARGLAKNPDARYTSAGDLAAAAHRALTGAETVAAATNRAAAGQAATDRVAADQAATEQSRTEPTAAGQQVAERRVAGRRVAGRAEATQVEGVAAVTGQAATELEADAWGATEAAAVPAITGSATGQVTADRAAGAQALVGQRVSGQEDVLQKVAGCADGGRAGDAAASALVSGGSRVRVLRGVIAVMAVILCATVALTIWSIGNRVSGVPAADSSAVRGPDIDLLAVVGPSGYKRANCVHQDPDATTVAIVYCAANPAASDPAGRFLRFQTVEQLRAYYRGLFFDVFRSTNCPGDPPGPDGPSVVDGKEVGRKACFTSLVDDPAVPKPGLVLTNEAALALAVYIWAGPGEQPLRDYVGLRNGFQFKAAEAAVDPDYFTAADRAVLDHLDGDFGPRNCRHLDPPAGPVHAMLGCGTRSGFPSAGFFGFPDRRAADLLYQANLGQFRGHACGAAGQDDLWRKDSAPVGRFFCYADTGSGWGTCIFALHDEFLVAAHFCTLRADDPDTGPKTEAELLAWFRKHIG
ncbi:serine/threonine-protein kinase [Nocardia brasiliensis]|uniref:serine/threonine-protein kinase n=1 Tax=Nocardia brasiliensis TaxID=37326 RepID=UPI0024586C8B|nr:serine/threonine-protein kinase [Nocardia brasiliensis]